MFFLVHSKESSRHPFHNISLALQSEQALTVMFQDDTKEVTRCICRVRQLAFNDGNYDYENFPDHHVLRIPSFCGWKRRHSLCSYLDFVDGLLIYTGFDNLPKTLKINISGVTQVLDCSDLWFLVDSETFEYKGSDEEASWGVFRLEFPSNLFLCSHFIDSYVSSVIYFEDNGLFSAEDVAVSGGFIDTRVYDQFNTQGDYPCKEPYKHLSTRRTDGMTLWANHK